MTADRLPAPFLVEHLRLPDPRLATRYEPAARLVVLPALRTSGLLSALPGEEVKSLLALLSFLTANGNVSATLPDIAGALGVPEGKVRARMERLITFLWEGQPLVREMRRDLGLDAYVPSPHLLAQEERHEREQKEQAHERKRREAESEALAAQGPTKRDAVYAQNRSLYAKPRAEVEREVMRLMGHAPEEADDTPEGEARRRLSRLGVPTEEADRIITTFPLQNIADQLDWLPHRNAKNPARFVVAAIEKRYDPPLTVVRERRTAQAKLAQAANEVFAAKTNQIFIDLLLPETKDTNADNRETGGKNDVSP